MKKVLAIAVIGATAVVAQANTISFTNNISSTKTDWIGENDVLTQFSSSLGTLNSVQLSLVAGLTTTLSVTNNAASASSGTAATEVQLSIDASPLGATESVLYGVANPVVDYLSHTFSYSLAAGLGTTSGTIGTDTTSRFSFYYANGSAITDSAILSALTGTGTVDLPITSLTQSVLRNTGGNTEATQVTYANMQSIVTYDYNPVPAPEPSTVAMIGTGLAGLGMMIRRRSVK